MGAGCLISGPGCLVCPWACCLVAPRVFRAPEAPAAREARRPHFVRRRASKPARALRTLRRPPHQWGWVAGVWLARRLEARPGPATAHRHRVRVQSRGVLPVLLALCTLNSGRTIALADSSSVHCYDVFKQSPSPSIWVSVPHCDFNCVVHLHHRQNGDIWRAKC